MRHPVRLPLPDGQHEWHRNCLTTDVAKVRNKIAARLANTESPPWTVDRPSNIATLGIVDRNAPINGQDRRPTVQICQKLNCMCHAFSTCFRSQCKLEWRGCFFTDCVMVCATNQCTMSPHTMPRTPPPDFSRAVSRPSRNNVKYEIVQCVTERPCV